MTDEEFAFYEKVYKAERIAYRKGVATGYVLAMLGYILIAIVMQVH